MHQPHINTPLSEIGTVLRRSQEVLVITHVSPDGDAIGSLLGLHWLLLSPGRKAARRVTLACADRVPAQFGFLPGADEIVQDPPARPWDVVVALDASDTHRLGSPFQPATYGSAPVVNLDHHITNLYFGQLNYVDPNAAATAQIVVRLAEEMGLKIGKEAALCLLTGLVSDTLGFRTSNVTPEVMATAMRLMKAGANLAEITERILNHMPLSLMRLWGLALAELRVEGQLVWTHITKEMRAQAGAPEESDGGLVSYLIKAPEARVAAVFAEKANGEVEVGLRARPGYDVSDVALSLGGGGHPQAAGCTIPGPLAEAEARVLPLLLSLSG